MALSHDLFAGVNEAVFVVEHESVCLKDSGSVFVAGLHLFLVEGVLVFLNLDAGILKACYLCGDVADQFLADLVDGRLIDFYFAYSYAVDDLDTFEGLHTKNSP